MSKLKKALVITLAAIVVISIIRAIITRVDVDSKISKLQNHN